MRVVSVFLAFVLLAAGSVAVVAAPDNGANGVAPGQNKDLLVTIYAGTGSPTPSGAVTSLGQAISGGFYGNTSSAGVSPYAPDNGHGVTPSIAPGPQVAGGGGPGTGTSLGEAIQALR